VFAIITVYSRGHPIELDVDIRSELERFDWIRPRWTADKLIAASPFRYDNQPSYFVSLEHGGWRDSGATDPEWSSGNFPKLLSFLRQETYEETVEYLLTEYSPLTNFEDTDKIALTLPNLIVQPSVYPTLDERILDAYNGRSPYLGGRGISEDTQQTYEIGFDRKRNAVTIPWRDGSGRLCALKYRSTWSRAFWYEPGGAPIRNLVYGINIVYDKRAKSAAIVEGEIDALTLSSAGMPAIATGGASNWNDTKRDIIVRSPLEEIVIVRDNDAAGKALQRRLIESLSPYMDVKIAVVPGRYKDVNEYAKNVKTAVNVSNVVGRSRHVGPRLVRV
jgi:DNA primase